MSENEKMDQKYTMDMALIELSKKTYKFQILHALACILLYGLSNQFFYSIPFYQAYPTLKCKNEKGEIIPKCNHKTVCLSNFTGSYEIDWDDDLTL